MGDLRQSRPRNTTSHRQFVVAVSSNDAEEIMLDMWFQRLQELSNDSPERMMGLSIYVGRHHSAHKLVGPSPYSRVTRK